MEQETAQELFARQSHEPFLVAMGGIAPAEGDVALREREQPAVGDGDAMSVGTEIAEHMFRATEGPLGVDDPVVAVEHPQPRREGTRLGERYQAAVEVKLTLMKDVAESGDELAAEDTAEHVDGQEERSSG
jgi:hypothetical protein